MPTVAEAYERYGSLVLRRCRELLRNQEQAMDAMHDVFVELTCHPQRIRDVGLASLLYRMATAVCLNALRSRRRRPEDADEARLLAIASYGDVEARGIAGQLLGRLFAQEKETTRTIAILHLLDGLTHEEVAREVGLSVSGVRKRLRNLSAHLTQLEGGEA